VVVVHYLVIFVLNVLAAEVAHYTNIDQFPVLFEDVGTGVCFEHEQA